MPTTIFFTGKGDGGKSSLGKKKVSKDEKLFELLGDLDLLNSWLGLCNVGGVGAISSRSKSRLLLPVVSVISDIQEAIFVAQAEIGAITTGVKVKNKPRSLSAGHYTAQQSSAGDDSVPRAQGISKERGKKIRREHVLYLEEVIFGIDNKMPAMKKFVVPGGSELSARIDIARTLARRAERTAVSFHKKRKLSPEFLAFLNRLSSVLFALARYTNFVLGEKEKNPKY